MIEAEAAPRANQRKLAGPILDNSGIAIERMPGLTFVLEGFRDALPGALAPLFGDGVTAGLVETRATSVFEATAHKHGGIAAILRCEAFDARLYFLFAGRAVDFVAASAFGAADSADEEAASAPDAARPATSIETRLLGAFAQALGEALEAGFAQCAQATFLFEGLQFLGEPNALGRRDMPAAATSLHIRTRTAASDCTILLPQSLLAPLRQELAVEPAGSSATADPRWTRQMEVGVSRARLPVTAIMEEMAMTLGDVARFNIGDILTLRGGGLGRLRLECAGRPMFWGRLGQGEGPYSLAIDEAISGDDADSIETGRTHG